MTTNSAVCAIVGVGAGLGLSLAKKFGHEGLQIAMLARRQSVLEDCQQQLSQAGVSAHPFVADAGQPESIRAAFAAVRSTLGDPQVLVYNAAVMKPGVPSRLDPDAVVAEFQVNVVGALVAAQAVLETMRANKKGTILLTGGGLALEPNPQVASLAIGKAAIRNLTYSLGKELDPDGIHVATVTICGLIKPGTHFDPDQIAEAYWKLHLQTPDQWEREITYR